MEIQDERLGTKAIMYMAREPIFRKIIDLYINREFIKNYLRHALLICTIQ